MQEVENGYWYLKGLFVHDISNLFQIISNSIELCESLLIEEENKDDIVEYFRLIARQLNRGKKLIRNVRNLSELEEFEMLLSPVEVFSKLKSAISFTLTSYPKKDVDINVISDYRSLYIMANELLIEAFENIITNSIIYNKNTIVQIEVLISVIDSHYKKYVKIEFKDNGTGINDARKDIIFQESHIKSSHSNGMGIGLSLVSKLIKLYGGKIWVENCLKGDSTKGSNFIILLPLAKEKECDV